MRRVLHTVRRGGAVVALVVLPLATPAFADRAQADTIHGGCTGKVNGVDASELTSNSPLTVHDGQQLRVEGSVPKQFAPQNPVSNTTVEVSIVDGVVGITSDPQSSTGATFTATDSSIDDYLQVGVGLYRIDVVNSGAGWTCEFTVYVQLAGDTLSKPAGLVALAAIVIGVIGLLFAKGRKPKEPGWIDGGLGTVDQIAREEAWQEAGQQYPDALEFDERGEHGFVMPSPIAPNERVVWAGKVRLHGHPVAGFFWGLLLGLGIGALGWQDGRWTVNLGSILLAPLLIAALSSLVAWVGWGYRIRDVAVLPQDAVPPPPAPMPTPAPAPDGAAAPDDTSLLEAVDGSGPAAASETGPSGASAASEESEASEASESGTAGAAAEVNTPEP